MSTSVLIKMNSAPVTKTAACTTGMSSDLIASIVRIPSPGIVNAVSMMNEPVSRIPKVVPMAVTTGRIALRNACRT